MPTEAVEVTRKGKDLNGGRTNPPPPRDTIEAKVARKKQARATLVNICYIKTLSSRMCIELKISIRQRAFGSRGKSWKEPGSGGANW